MTRPQSAIAATGLRKSFGDHLVLDGIDLDVAEGTIFALLGPNGAGKTTIVQILSTLIGADGGEVRVAGHDLAREPDAVRAAIGVTGQFSAVDNLLTGEENLILMADLHHLGRAEGRRRAAELLERFDLVDAATKTAATYSGGMRRRLDLAMGLVGDPRIVFLDEPTTGLDPRSRRTMWQIIRDLVAGGVTVFLTTQYLEEADQLADRIAVLDHGKLVAEGTADELKRLVPGGHISLRFADASELESAARALGAGLDRDDDELTLQLPSDGGVRSLRACSTASTPNRSRSTSCRSTPPTSTTSSSPSPATPTTRRNRCDEHPFLRRDRLGDDAAAPAPAHAALPVDDGAARRHAGRPPAAVRLRLRRHARRRARRRLRRPRRLRQLRHPRDPADHRGRRRPGDGDLGRHGHDRGHHRPVPHHGHLPRLGADRPRPRQP